jgi:hypothetical protein
MIRRLVASAALAATALGGSLFATTGPVSAQSEWARVPTQSGPTNEVVVGALGSAFFLPPAYLDHMVVGVEWGVPTEITRGPRGETALMGTYGSAFRMPTLIVR